MRPRTSLPIASAEPDGRDVTRRQLLLHGVGATVTAAVGLLPACSRPPSEKLVPYRDSPRHVAGQALRYATASCQDGYASGVLVTTYDGRPTKVEGNPDHPSSLGAASLQQQAALMDLYNPRRQLTTMQNQRLASPSRALQALRASAPVADGGRGLHIVLPPTSSPTLGKQLDRLQDAWSSLNLHFASAFPRLNALRGAKLATGEFLETRIAPSEADVLLLVDSDLLGTGPAHLAHARQFAVRREPGSGPLNRVYVVEARESVTGQCADHRLALRDSEIPAFVAALLLATVEELRSTPGAVDAHSRRLISLAERVPLVAQFARQVARDLVRHRRRAAVVVGDRQPSSLHAAAIAINQLLGADDRLLDYAASPIYRAGEAEHDSLPALTAALDGHDVRALLVLDVDINQLLPRRFSAERLVSRADRSFYVGPYACSTARACQWQIAAQHFLEQWSDARALDGTASVIQPVIAPLATGCSAHDVLAALLSDTRDPRERIRASLDESFGLHGEQAWEEALARGVLEGSALPPKSSVTPTWDFLPELLALPPSQNVLELVVHDDRRLMGGRFGQNPWLVELPDPITKLCWTNAALLGEATAARCGVVSGDRVELHNELGRKTVGALVVAGQAEGTIGLAAGWGDPDALTKDGANAFELLDARLAWHGPVQLRRTGEHAQLPVTQNDMGLAEADHVSASHATVLALAQQPDLFARFRERRPSLYESDVPQATRQWGMAIDLSRCTGCSICVLACQAENNVPTVGATGVLKGRQMHWLRVDRYTSKDTKIQQPMACQHCEHAPCEYVCPTAATVHSSDGLNQMVYNRCVGTRFCSNNCPYKVRRFNWFDYHAQEPTSQAMIYNPNVTVRERGVMEKCTYCVQRIRRAEIDARVQERLPFDGDVVTACEQACPSGAIVFGDLADPSSRVSQWHGSKRATEVLGELGTRPRTRYLAKLSNPNPEIS